MERVNKIRTLVPTFQLEFLQEPILFDLVKVHFDRMVFVTKSIPIKKENEIPVLDMVYLRYFVGGKSFFLMALEKSFKDNTPIAYGLLIDSRESKYVFLNLEEEFKAGHLELDFDFEPKTVRDLLC